MSTRNLLIVALDPVSEDEIRTAVQERKEGEDVNVHVVAPATHVGTLQWLTGAEDEARAEAEELADRTAQAVEDADVEAEVGDRDPLLAVEDALALFPADEILVAGVADEKAEAALRGFGLPISRLDRGTGDRAGGPATLRGNVAKGRSATTPFVMVGAVAAIVFTVMAVVSALVFLVYWLA